MPSPARPPTPSGSMSSATQFPLNGGNTQEVRGSMPPMPSIFLTSVGTPTTLSTSWDLAGVPGSSQPFPPGIIPRVYFVPPTPPSPVSPFPPSMYTWGVPFAGVGCLSVPGSWLTAPIIYPQVAGGLITGLYTHPLMLHAHDANGTSVLVSTGLTVRLPSVSFIVIAFVHWLIHVTDASAGAPIFSLRSGDYNVPRGIVGIGLSADGLALPSSFERGLLASSDLGVVQASLCERFQLTGPELYPTRFDWGEYLRSNTGSTGPSLPVSRPSTPNPPSYAGTAGTTPLPHRGQPLPGGIGDSAGGWGDVSSARVIREDRKPGPLGGAEPEGEGKGDPSPGLDGGGAGGGRVLPRRSKRLRVRVSDGGRPGSGREEGSPVGDVGSEPSPGVLDVRGGEPDSSPAP